MLELSKGLEKNMRAFKILQMEKTSYELPNLVWHQMLGEDKLRGPGFFWGVVMKVF